MLKALWQDLQVVPGVEVEVLLGEGWPAQIPVNRPCIPAHDHDTEFIDRVVRNDAVLLIAPETDGLLLKYARLVEECDGTLLGPTPEGIELAGDKLALADHWHASKIPTAITMPYDELVIPFPIVCKPRHGAGSQGIFVAKNRESLARADLHSMIFQPWLPGHPASVALLLGFPERFPLRSAFQVLSHDGFFRYHGGMVPLPPPLEERALALAEKAVACVPGLQGYVGVDLVLGPAADGSEDYAIEINPRLTTSYIGLRALAETNLANAMLRVARGELIELRWRPGIVQFTADGKVRGEKADTPLQPR